MVNQSSNRTIAKNTIMLYFRMMLTMVVSLYTSRVIIQTLGVDDYGIYQTVGGIVGFLGFLNSALATGSSRFLTFELGKGNFDRLRQTFSTTLFIHIVLALLIVVAAETVGLWFLYNKLVIPVERMDAAVWCFHLSILAAVVSITQVPYNALIIAHEKMSVYAYVSIVEVSLKLAIVYMLMLGNFDKLKLYSTLYLLLNCGLQLFYRLYCRKKFKESHFSFSFDKKILGEIGSFSGWSLLSNASIAMNSQGILIILNMFFSPAVVTARAISLQVNGVVNQFVNNFRAAVNPQITKRLAAGDVEGSKSLLLDSSVFSYYLILILGLPIYFTADKLLNLWLGVVPDYAVIFLQLIVVQSLFTVLDTSLYQALYAKGRIKENALISPFVGFVRFPITYVLFKMGFSPVAFSILCIFSYFLLGCFIKPWLLVRVAGYRWADFLRLFPACIKVTFFALPLPYLTYFFLYKNIGSEIMALFVQGGVSVVSALASVWFVGLNRRMKTKIVEMVNRKIRRI